MRALLSTEIEEKIRYLCYEDAYKAENPPSDANSRPCPKTMAADLAATRVSTTVLGPNDIVSGFWDNEFYGRLRRRAASLLKREVLEDRLQPEDLIHETYLRLEKPMLAYQVTDGDHYMAIAIRTMRRCLIDRSRSQRAFKRFGTLKRAALTDQSRCSHESSYESLLVTDTIERFFSQIPRRLTVARMHFLEARSIAEIGYTLAVSTRTVKRELKVIVDLLKKEFETPTRTRAEPGRGAHIRTEQYVN